MAPPRKNPELSEKEREQYRKQQHSSIERKRRLKINKCMEELKKLVPKSNTQLYLHQLTILENACDYIRELQSMIPQDDMPVVERDSDISSNTSSLATYQAEFKYEWSPPSPAKSEKEESASPMNILSLLC
jgi:hypothetical protein